MSKVCQCDRCGEVYKPKRLNVGDSVFKLGIGHKCENGQVHIKTMDLCEKCQTGLAMFVLGVVDDDDFTYVIEIVDD